VWRDRLGSMRVLQVGQVLGCNEMRDRRRYRHGSVKSTLSERLMTNSRTFWPVPSCRAVVFQAVFHHASSSPSLVSCLERAPTALRGPTSCTGLRLVAACLLSLHSSRPYPEPSGVRAHTPTWQPSPTRRDRRSARARSLELKVDMAVGSSECRRGKEGARRMGDCAWCVCFTSMHDYVGIFAILSIHPMRAWATTRRPSPSPDSQAPEKRDRCPPRPGDAVLRLRRIANRRGSRRRQRGGARRKDGPGERPKLWPDAASSRARSTLRTPALAVVFAYRREFAPFLRDVQHLAHAR
jgi:hypothetical protein